MAMILRQAFAASMTALAIAAALYQIAALVLVRAFFAGAGAGAGAAAAAPSTAAVSLLKPLHGAEPQLAGNLASFLDVAHDGPLQMVCGVNDAQDRALPAVRAMIAAHPAADIAVSTGPAAPGANGKIGNLIAMLRLASHDILVLSDSDMVAGRDYLAQVLAALAQPGVGAVTCLYAGRGDAGFASRLGAAMISYSALPNMVLAYSTGLARPCMGSTIALRRETLAAIGGLPRFADVLADDHAIGAGVAAQGLRVAIPRLLMIHAGAERNLGELWRHQLRWAVTIRGVAPAGHWGSIVTHAVPLALIAAVCRPLAGGLTLIAALALRFALAAAIDRIHERRTAPLWLIPLADCAGFVIFCASLAARRVDWRGARLTLAADGRITAPMKRHR